MAVEVAIGVCFTVCRRDGSNPEFKINSFSEAGRIPVVRKQKEVTESRMLSASLGETPNEAPDGADPLDFTQEDGDPVENLVHVDCVQEIHRQLVVALPNDRNIPGIDRSDGLLDLLEYFFGRGFMPVFWLISHRGFDRLRHR
jgi:hypothetical protein